MTFSKELLGELLEGCERSEDLLGDAGLLGTELTAHLGYEPKFRSWRGLDLG